MLLCRWHMSAVPRLFTSLSQQSSHLCIQRRQFRACCWELVNERHARQATARTSFVRSAVITSTVKLMQANGCTVSFQKFTSAAVVSAVERALGTCRGTVYVDLRSVPVPSLHTLDLIGQIYGRVAEIAPQRNVVPLLSSAYPQGKCHLLIPGGFQLFLPWM